MRTSTTSFIPECTFRSIPFGIVREGARIIHSVVSVWSSVLPLVHLANRIHTETGTCFADKTSSLGEIDM